MSGPTECRRLLRAKSLDRDLFAKRFDESAAAERVALMESIDARAQMRIWDAAEGCGVTIAEMVPPDRGPLDPVVFHGKNSLPAFTRFQKRFCRPSAAIEADELWGFNYQPTRWLAPLTGPGYFVAYDAKDPLGGVAIDYRRIPADRPDDWPRLRDNERGLGRLVYGGMVDYLRRVSEHLLIGRATRGDKALPNTFLLCKE